MAIYCVTHARFEGDKLTHLRMGLVDPSKPAFVGPMQDLPVIDVVDLITSNGDQVYLSLMVNGLTPPGVRLRVRASGGGVEELVEEGGADPGRGIADLPRM